jgi:hypothetical protein
MIDPVKLTPVEQLADAIAYETAVGDNVSDARIQELADMIADWKRAEPK